MIVGVALLVGVAVWLALPPPADPRLDALLPRRRARQRAAPARETLTWVATASAVVGLLMLAPWPIGPLVGAGAWVGVPRFLRTLEPRAMRRDRDLLAVQGPVVADLLAATLAAGAPMRTALSAVQSAVDRPAADHLAGVVAALDLGADPIHAWSALADDPALGPVAAAVVRSARTGAPLSSLLTRLADDMRRQRRTVVEIAARSAGVRAVVPLAACFLPAFLLLGVVPVVAALAQGLVSS